MTTKKNEHLIVRKPVELHELPDHQRHESLPFPIFMGKDLVPEAKMWACNMYIKDIPQELVDVMDHFKATPHRHDYDELYLMIGDENAITFEVMLGDEFYEVATPGSVYIPKGLAHAIRPVAATVGLTGGLIPVCLNGEYTTKPV